MEYVWIIVIENREKTSEKYQAHASLVPFLSTSLKFDTDFPLHIAHNETNLSCVEIKNRKTLVTSLLYHIT